LLYQILADSELIEQISREASNEKLKVSADDVRRVVKILLNEFNGAPLPLSWRAIATINLVDRTHLFRLGFALLRRFPLVLYSPIYERFRPEFNLDSIKVNEESKNKAEQILNYIQNTLIKLAAKELLRSNPVFPSDKVVRMTTPLEKVINDVLKIYRDVFTVIAKLVANMYNIGIEIGPAILLDICKVILIASSLDIKDRAFLFDLLLSSLILPQLGSVMPAIRSELLLLGSQRRLDAIRNIKDMVIDIVGKRSRSATYLEVLSLELPL